MPWQKSFQLRDFENFWRISPVQLHNGYGALEVQKSLLDEGRKKTFPEWENYTQAAIRRDEFYVGSSPMHYALIDLLCENEDHPVYGGATEKIREFLEIQAQRSLLTLSKTTYRPFPYPDSATHIQGTQKYEEPEHLFGSSGPLARLWDADRMCTALFGKEDAKRVIKVNHWFSQKDTYLAREHDKPKTSHEKAVCFIAGPNGFHIGINCPISQTYCSALGMRIRGLKEVDY